MVGRKKGWSTYRGKFAALKSSGPVLWKSQLVRDYLYLLEYNQDVLTYENCALEVHYTHAGESHILAPDLRVCRRDSLQLIKLISGRDETDSRGAVHLPAALSRVEDYDLRILTESEVRQQPCLNNVKLLWRYARVPVEGLQLQLICLDSFMSGGRVPLCELIQFFTQRHLSEAEVFALMFRGVLSVDMTNPINPLEPRQLHGNWCGFKERSLERCKTSD